MVFAILLLLTGLTISSVAIYYSVMGLTAIFAAAYYPIIVMGVSLELAKLVAATWLKAYWSRIPILLKSYMLVAVILLMVITSMGIFGFLSKAHSDQTLVSGDVLSRLAVYDEQIKTSRENIEASKKALQQMDSQVDQLLGRTDTERGAERAVQIRRNQAKERARLQSEIATEQKQIAKLNKERAPIAAENRKIEAEVGPIKYIAKFIYGDNPDANLLEKAVTWVIIMIVIVFDPLAVLLLIASQMSYFWWREDRNNKSNPEPVTSVIDEPEVVVPPLPQKVLTHCPKCNTELEVAPGIGPFCPNKDCDVIDGLEQASKQAADQAVEDFFQRAKNIAKLADIQEEQRKIDEANQMLDEIRLEEPQYEADDGPLTSDQILQIKESVQENNEPYPFPLWRPVEGDAKLAAEPWQWPKSPDLVWTDDDSDQEMASDLEDFKEVTTKRKWKEENPEVNLKEIKHQYAIGAIEKLPWETVIELDQEISQNLTDNITEEKTESTEIEDEKKTSQKKNDIHNNVAGQTDTGEETREVKSYVQNQEQNENSIWLKIKNKNL